MRVENQRLLVSFIFCLVLVQLVSLVKADFSEQLYQRGLLELRSGRAESATHLFRQSIEQMIILPNLMELLVRSIYK